MYRARDFGLFLKGLISCLVIFNPRLIRFCVGGELPEHEFESFLEFIRAVDPRNELRMDWNASWLSHPCSGKVKGVKCSFQYRSVMKITLENLNLSGRIDGESLCKLRHLRVLSLARNRIHGEIPTSLSHCSRLVYLNLSNNNLTGKIPEELIKSKNLRRLDLSKNHFSGVFSHFEHEIKYFLKYSDKSEINNSTNNITTDAKTESREKAWHKNWVTTLPLIFGIIFFFVFIYFVTKRRKDSAKSTHEKDRAKAFKESPYEMPRFVTVDEVKDPAEERRSDLVFFVDENERFTLEDLLESTADLRKQSVCSSLYKVRFRNGLIYAVKRLKNFQVSFVEFRQVMWQIGNLKHQNILPLVGYHSTSDEKLLIYKYQSNGSLLNLLDDYIEGKKEFPWRLRLSIAVGIAQGINFIHQKSSNLHNSKIIPHGNLKLSNILLDENHDPLISEYGISKLLYPKKPCLLSPKEYLAPEKTYSEKGDVYSFGVILLELLTGKSVEKTEIDLLKWVKAIVREEWTGEVFDKEVSRGGRQSAFTLLNVSLKCLSDSPYNRPTMAEVLDKVEEVVNNNTAQEDNEHSFSSFSSLEYSQQDFSLLRTTIPEGCETPGSNY